MRATLRALMAFNHEVTSVDIRTREADHLAVVEAMEGFIETWKQQLCQSIARSHIAPYSVSTLEDFNLIV